MFNLLSLMILTLSMILSFVSFSTKRKHLLTSLIMLEMMVLMLFMSLSMLMFLKHINSINLMYFLVLAVCESALGLSILILMVRSRGTELFSILNLLKW